MSGGRERDLGVHDRTIDKSSPKEEDNPARNPLDVIVEKTNQETKAPFKEDDALLQPSLL